MQLKRNSPTILKVLAGTMFLVFAATGLWLLFLAFEIGDVYPPYSSHRTELDGTAVLYEALRSFPDLRVARHYGPAVNAPSSTETTIIVAGVSPSDWYLGDEDELRDLISLAERGTRLVLTLQPLTLRPLLERATDPKERTTKEKEETRKPVQPVGERLLRVAVKFGARPQPSTSNGRTVKQAYMALDEKSEPLPGRLPWRAQCYLEPRDGAWKTVYSWSGQPVLLRRAFGKGEIILIADSFLLTNRAMWEDRHPDFLTWLLGERRAVLFYERHLGVAEDPGVAWLIRRYNLDGVVAALLIIMALVVWRNSVALVPLQAAGEEPESVQTMSRGSSLLALVSRSLPPSEVLQVCVDEWKKTERPGREVADEIEKLSHEKGDIVAIYRQIMKAVKDRS
ncbi:MAG: hypothetical protein EHM18_07750 [Acidobacteria bacterium]|nr:MAG: hypothetical protein EHM18_07750 [Acidobacteriota bacterium]